MNEERDLEKELIAHMLEVDPHGVAETLFSCGCVAIGCKVNAEKAKSFSDAGGIMFCPCGDESRVIYVQDYVAE